MIYTITFLITLQFRFLLPSVAKSFNIETIPGLVKILPHSTTNNMNYQSTFEDNGNKNVVKEEILYTHIPRLSAQSEALKNLSYKEQLQIIDEIKEQLRSKSWIYADEEKKIQYSDYEAALLQLGPKPSFDANGNYRRIKHSRDANSYKASSEFFIAYCTLGVLNVYSQRLKYELQKLNNKKQPSWRIPTLLSRVRPLFDHNLSKSPSKDYADPSIFIHGRASIPFLFHNFEVWTNRNQNQAYLYNNANDCESLLHDSDNDSTNNNESEDDEKGITLVLSAGNQSNIGILDVLHCIFIHPRKPVLLKHHPLRSFLDRPYKEILKPLIQRSFIHIIDDYGNDFTQSLVSREEVAHVHLTGSLVTSNILNTLYGETRPHLSKEEVTKRITSELGCASPVIITPSKRYSTLELRNCVKHIIFSKKMNAGSNCLMSQAIIISADWKQKKLFREILKDELSKTPTDPCYYPGSLKKVAEIVEKYDSQSVQQIQGPMVKRSRYFDSNEPATDDDKNNDDYKHHPYLIECGLFGSTNYNGYALQNEAFGPVLAIVELPKRIENVNTDETMVSDETGIDFLVNSAVPFVNNKQNIYGTLSCILMHPTKSPFSYQKYQNLIKQQVISKLQYGTVNVNTNTFMGFAAYSYGGQWSAHSKDVMKQSGNGFVGNGLRIKAYDKTVVYGQSLSFPIVLMQRRFMLPSYVYKLITNIALLVSKLR